MAPPDGDRQTSSSDALAVPILVDFLAGVPAPLVTALIGLAPLISTVRHGAEIISWKSPRHDSWLLIAAWWATCLLAAPITRYFLPIAAIGILVASKWFPLLQSSPLPATEHTLQTTIADLLAIKSLLPSLSTQPLFTPPPKILFRMLFITYVPYLILTRLVTVPTLFGIAGTLLLTHRAPWSSTLRNTLWSSAHVRWGVYYLYSLLSGTPLPHTPITPTTKAAPPPPPPGDAVKFMFTIYENQRWWMGLDWTAALLPTDRPSWCGPPPALHPVAPPNAFNLPAQTSVVIPNGHGALVRRTACWDWEDGEWRVVVKREVGVVAVRVEKPFPKEKEKEKEGGAFLRKRSRPSLSSVSGDTKGLEKEETGDIAESGEEVLTDADGWVYGDNKWENLSNKGGISKYTRLRRWTRVAILHEIIEQLPPELHHPTTESKSNVDPPTAPQPLSPSAELTLSPVQSPEAVKTVGEQQSDDKDRLRRRLKNALQLEPQS